MHCNTGKLPEQLYDELHLKKLSIRRGHKRLLLFHLSYEELFFIVNF